MIKRFTIQIILRVILILLGCLVLAYFINRSNWFTAITIVLIVTFMVGSLIRYVNRTNVTLVRFLDALKNKDYSVYFSQTQEGNSFKDVFEDFNQIIKIFEQNKIDKEAQFEYFKQILEQVNLGIISIHKSDLNKTDSENEILFLNQTACDILGQPKHKYWHRFIKPIPWFLKEINQMSDGGKTLVERGKELDHQQLSIDVVSTRSLETEYLIISVQDIHTEIEQKEMEAWHNIIRVLAHEMMNSFTPVSSLASTLKSMTENEEGQVLPIGALDNETIVDINLGASTIKKRADGLLEFVKDYRKISNVPVPHIKPVQVHDFIAHVERLMTPIIKEQNVELKINTIQKKTNIWIDQNLVEQVFINLIGNSLHALKGREKSCITISYSKNENHTVISIHDNGKGISPEIRKNIFVPFYTTRDTGSGIGLSLSKTIMQKHNGNIFVKSEEGKYTLISLVFPPKDEILVLS